MHKNEFNNSRSYFSVTVLIDVRKIQHMYEKQLLPGITNCRYNNIDVAHIVHKYKAFSYYENNNNFPMS